MHICGVDLHLCTEAFMVSETPGRIQTKHSVEGGGSTKRSDATELLKADEHDHCVYGF